MQRTSFIGIAPAVAACALLACQGAIGPQGLEGPPGPQGMTGPQGMPGAAGQPGADGSIRIYGDGSAGSVTISANTNWATTPPNAAHNYQFSDLTIASGFTLTVPSGLVIRVSGAVTNNGAIVVQTFASGGFIDIVNVNSTDTIQRYAGSGSARSPAAYGERATGGATSLLGGRGGEGMGTAAVAASAVRPGPLGGGGGAGCLSGTLGDQSSVGTFGGGTLTILAGGALSSAGTITADGESTAVATGSGGGGGGIILLASRTSVTNTGTINARGGSGGGSGVSNGTGGGGGGGIVQLISPMAANTGAIAVTGGAGGTVGAAGSVTGTSTRQGGGGGGGSGGNGGTGGSISGSNPGSAGTGSSGLSIIRTGVDPTSLF